MNIIESQKTLLAYDFNTSAKKTGKALAVIETSEGQKRVKQLTCIDLNAQSIWAKIVLWWNQSLDLRTINNFINELPMPEEQLKRANIEKQINHIQQKILRSDRYNNEDNDLYRRTIKFRPNTRWMLQFTLVYPETIDSEGKAMDDKRKEVNYTMTYNRLTTNREIRNILFSQKGSLSIGPKHKSFEQHGSTISLNQVRDVHFSLSLMSTFKTHSYKGDYDSKDDETPYLSDNQVGADKSFRVELSNYQTKPKTTIPYGAVDAYFGFDEDDGLFSSSKKPEFEGGDLTCPF